MPAQPPAISAIQRKSCSPKWGDEMSVYYFFALFLAYRIEYKVA
jgi:hypothetical protein